MKVYVCFLLVFSTILGLSGCSSDASNDSATGEQGWHFQGRDCLACHNVDLGEDKYLLFGGTVYKEDGVTNQDDMSKLCGGELLVNFLDASLSPVYTSKDYKDSGSAGYNAKGNIFIFQRKLRLLASGTYYAQITDVNGTVMAISNFSHNFTSQDYDINNPDDDGNRLSCNSCHIKGGKTNPLFVQINNNLCQ